MNDPLLPHLLDILPQPESPGLILGGGYGLTIKRKYLIESGVRTLSRELPEARATTDLDLFLRIDIFQSGTSQGGIRAVLDRLGYKELTPKWQFENPATKVVVDLHARLPAATDAVKVSGIRVGSGATAGIHGRLVREAFAVEEMSELIPVEGTRTDGTRVETSVAVPHPYAWLCMKVRAAMDWVRWVDGSLTLREGQREPSPKHAFDACLIVAMLTEEELEQAHALGAHFRDEQVATEIRVEAMQLFSTPLGRGWVEAQRQANRGFERELIWPALSAMLAPLEG